MLRDLVALSYLPMAVVYIISIYVLAFRLAWLRSSGRQPDAPTSRDFLLGRLGWNSYRFVFSNRHKQFADPLVTALTILCRALILTFLPLFAIAMWPSPGEFQ